MIVYDYRLTRGFAFSLTIKNAVKLIIVSYQGEKYTFASTDGTFNLTAEDTTAMQAGRYAFQAFSVTGIVKQGSLYVARNLALDDESSLGYWRGVLEAIDAMIAGRATQEQKEISVGDKKITYYSLSELLKLRDWVLGQLAEEEAEETGEELTNSPTDEQVIKLWWRNA